MQAYVIYVLGFSEKLYPPGGKNVANQVDIFAYYMLRYLLIINVFNWASVRFFF